MDKVLVSGIAEQLGIGQSVEKDNLVHERRGEGSLGHGRAGNRGEGARAAVLEVRVGWSRGPHRARKRGIRVRVDRRRFMDINRWIRHRAGKEREDASGVTAPDGHGVDRQGGTPRSLHDIARKIRVTPPIQIRGRADHAWAQRGRERVRFTMRPDRSNPPRRRRGRPGGKGLRRFGEDRVVEGGLGPPGKFERNDQDRVDLVDGVDELLLLLLLFLLLARIDRGAERTWMFSVEGLLQRAAEVALLEFTANIPIQATICNASQCPPRRCTPANNARPLARGEFNASPV